MEEAWELAVVSQKLKIFISWSGAYSNALSEAFAEWLDKVVQSVETFVSSADIESGSRWGSRLGGELSELDFGVAFVTAQNKEAPWVLFEAGALSKNIKESRFTPILCGISNVDLTGNPLIQFQTRELNLEGMKKLVHSIFKAADEDAYSKKKVDDIFEVWWPQFEGRINELTNSGNYDAADTVTTEPSLYELESSVSDLVGAIRDLSTQQQTSSEDVNSQLQLIKTNLSDVSEMEPHVFNDFEDFKAAFMRRFKNREVNALVERLDDIGELEKILKVCETFGFPALCDKIKARIEKLSSSSVKNEEE